MRELDQRFPRVAPLDACIGAGPMVGLAERLIMLRRGREGPRRDRELVIEARLPVTDRPAAPEQQRPRGVVAVEPRCERPQLVIAAEACEAPAQRPLGAERPNLLADPGVDRRIRIRERALPAAV